VARWAQRTNLPRVSDRAATAHRERGGAEICKPEIRCDDGRDAGHVGGVILAASLRRLAAEVRAVITSAGELF
jgi:hypothetical protein